MERTTLGPPTNTNNIIFNKSARSYVKTFYFCMCVIWYFLFVCLFFRNELLKTRQLAVTKLFNLLKLSTDDTAKYVPLLRSHFLFTLLFFNRAIFVWPWHENARTKQKQQTNGNRAIWLVYRTDTNARGFWKKLHARELSRNQSILRFDVILPHDRPIERCLLHIRVFFGGKTKRPRFDFFFIHWLIKQ